MNTIKEVSPYALISPLRLDIAVKYMYFQCLHLDYMTDAVADLYDRHIMLRTGGIEPIDLFGNLSKKTSIEDYKTQSVSLLASLKKDGFKAEFPIPVSSTGIRNGAHRLAASLVLKKPIVVNYFEGPSGIWDYNWFKNNNFSQDDLMRILRAFILISPEQSAIFTFWGSSEKIWQPMSQFLSENIDIVGTIDLDFTGQTFAFSELIKDIYKIIEPTDGTDNISRKINILSEANLKLRVIVAWKSIDSLSKGSIFDKVKEIKEKCRKQFKSILQESAFVTLHSSGDHEESLHLANILLSPNNILRLRQRMNTFHYHQDVFCAWLKEFSAVANANNICIDNTCIVGSSPLEVVGIRASTDIDFTLISKDRIRFGSGVTKLSDNIDIVTEKYHRSKENCSAVDDALITLDDLHFFYRGFRFADIDVVYDRKLFSARDKDLRDVALIDSFRTTKEHTVLDAPFRLKSEITNELIVRRFTEIIRGLENQLRHYNYLVPLLENRIKILEEYSNEHKASLGKNK